MKKTNILWLVMVLIFLIIFNVIFFMIGGFDHKSSVWISYGFIHFAYLTLLLTPVLIHSGRSVAVFGFSLYSVSLFYFLAELVVGVVFIMISLESYKIALIIQLCFAGLYGIALIFNMIANENTASVEGKRQYQIEYVKKASAELNVLLDAIGDKEANKIVEKVYDAIYSSPVKTHSNLAQIEAQILVSINSFKNAVYDGDKVQMNLLADALLISINERNRQLKILN